jgi:hypothetical protein
LTGSYCRKKRYEKINFTRTNRSGYCYFYGYICEQGGRKIMLLKLLIMSAVLVGFALLAMAVSIIAKPGGRFPDTHVGHNKEMRNRGITCAQNTDTGCNPVNGAGCFGCALVNDEED